MLQTYEAIVEQNGMVRLLEDVWLNPSQKVLVTVLDHPPSAGTRPSGLAEGMFVVPDDFDDPLPDEILELFEGS